jgi:hypothetical protein
VENQRVGKSRLRFYDGSEYIGQFVDDTADGVGLFTDKGGDRYMAMVDEQDGIKQKHGERSDNGYFLQGKLYGRGQIKYKNGDTYEGILKGTRRHGKGHMSLMTPKRDGDIIDIGEFEGSYIRDRRHLAE